MEHSAVCSYHVQSRIMHNVTVQLLTAGSHKIIYTFFYGHEELIFEVVPNEILLGPNSILRECAGFLPCIRCIFIKQNTDSFKLHMWIGMSPLTPFGRGILTHGGRLTIIFYFTFQVFLIIVSTVFVNHQQICGVYQTGFPSLIVQLTSKLTWLWDPSFTQ